MIFSKEFITLCKQNKIHVKASIAALFATLDPQELSAYQIRIIEKIINNINPRNMAKKSSKALDECYPGIKVKGFRVYCNKSAVLDIDIPRTFYIQQNTATGICVVVACEHSNGHDAEREYPRFVEIGLKNIRRLGLDIDHLTLDSDYKQDEDALSNDDTPLDRVDPFLIHHQHWKSIVDALNSLEFKASHYSLCIELISRLWMLSRELKNTIDGYLPEPIPPETVEILHHIKNAQIDLSRMLAQFLLAHKHLSASIIRDDSCYFFHTGRRKDPLVPICLTGDECHLILEQLLDCTLTDTFKPEDQEHIHTMVYSNYVKLPHIFKPDCHPTLWMQNQYCDELIQNYIHRHGKEGMNDLLNIVDEHGALYLTPSAASTLLQALDGFKLFENNKSLKNKNFRNVLAVILSKAKTETIKNILFKLTGGLLEDSNVLWLFEHCQKRKDLSELCVNLASSIIKSTQAKTQPYPLLSQWLSQYKMNEESRVDLPYPIADILPSKPLSSEVLSTTPLTLPKSNRKPKNELRVELPPDQDLLDQLNRFFSPQSPTRRSPRLSPKAAEDANLGIQIASENTL